MKHNPLNKMNQAVAIIFLLLEKYHQKKTQKTIYLLAEQVVKVIF